MLSSLCVLNTFILVSVCSDNSSENENALRVINGWPANLGDVPYQLAFKQMVSRKRRMYMTFCGGVILSPTKVLSAAHCFEQKGSKCFSRGTVSQRHLRKSVAVAGNLYNAASFKADSKEEGQWRQLKSMNYPKRYKFPTDDIAVGFTKQAFIINEHVAPIPFARRFNEYKGQCLASGYGRISSAKKAGSVRLLLANLDIVSTSACSRLHRRNMIKFVCTDIRRTDVAQGDSGGPLVCKDTNDPNKAANGILVGVVSGARVGVGTFFTRVSIFSKFIDRGDGTLCEPNIVFVCFCLIYGIAIFILFYLCWQPNKV